MNLLAVPFDFHFAQLNQQKSFLNFLTFEDLLIRLVPE